MKEAILASLKRQWKVAVESQYKETPDKVRNADIEKNADEIVGNPAVKAVMKTSGITREDIKRILTEIKSEVCDEGEG